MSYDVELTDPETGRVYELPYAMAFREGTQAVGGAMYAETNITYNYSNHFYTVLGKKGIRELYGKRAEDTLPLLESAINALNDDADEDYWKSTEGNARLALIQLLMLARMFPDGIWQGD